MWIATAAAAGLVGTVLALILGQYRPEFRMLVTVSVTLLLALSGINGSYALLLLKAVGICLLTQMAGDTCRDSGEGSIASKIELAGRSAILLITLPMIQEVLGWAWELINI